MADNHAFLPTPTPEQRRIAAAQFEKANEVLASGTNYDYAIQMLLTCCKLDAANLPFRQKLRLTQKAKYKNNLRGSMLSGLSTLTVKARLRAAQGKQDHAKVLEIGEQVLCANPWDLGTQQAMAEAAKALGLVELAVWTLEQVRHKHPKNLAVNRSLARLYEKQGNFKQAIALWELVRKADPDDLEAAGKGQALAASDTIARGRYEEVLQANPLAEDTADDEIEDSSKPAVETETEPFDRFAREAAPLRARIHANPTNVQGYLQLVELYRRGDQLEQARAVLEEGLAATANNFELAVELAELDIQPFRQNLALTEQKLRAAPQDEDLRKIRVRLLKEINTRELDLFRQKGDRYPTELGHRFELGVRLLRAGQVDEAIRELQLARGDQRYHWRALLYLGYCFKSRNNWRLAQRNFEEALTSLPPQEANLRKELLFQLAQGHAEAGGFAKAVDLAYELANLDFSYRDIGKLLDEWQKRLQQA